MLSGRVCLVTWHSHLQSSGAVGLEEEDAFALYGVEQEGATKDLSEKGKTVNGWQAMEKARNKWAIVSVFFIARMQFYEEE